MPKGQIPWNKGKIGVMSLTARKRISAKLLGVKKSLETRKKMSDYWKGKPKPFNKNKKSLIGRRWKLSEETKKKMSLSKKGKPNLWMRGEKHHAWKGGITPTYFKIRMSLEYKLWRTAVFERDNYTCIWCGAKCSKDNPVYLEADHIKPFCNYPELRFAIDNGRTLCRECHKKTDTYGYKASKS